MTAGYNSYEVTIRGAAPLIMHNGQSADPLSEYAQALKTISSKRNKVESDYRRMAELEWEAALYLDPDDGRRIVLAGHTLESCIIDGSKRSKKGPTAKASVYVEGDGEFLVAGHRVSVDEIKGKPEYRLSTGVRVAKARIIRTRPLFRDWSARFRVTLMSALADKADVERWIRDAGLYVGIGDWRPRYGRFELIDFQAN